MIRKIRDIIDMWPILSIDERHIVRTSMVGMISCVVFFILGSILILKCMG